MAGSSIPEETDGTRGCHGYIPDDYIRALIPNTLRIRAGNTYPKSIKKKGGEDISILSDINCKIILDPYARYESPDTGIHTVMRLSTPGEFFLNTVELTFWVPKIRELIFEDWAAASGDLARPEAIRSVARLDPIALLSECNTTLRTVILMSVHTNGWEPPPRLPFGR